jgi:hypothetical protein
LAAALAAGFAAGVAAGFAAAAFLGAAAFSSGTACPLVFAPLDLAIMDSVS